jgi:hypothetical protein
MDLFPTLPTQQHTAIKNKVLITMASATPQIPQYISRRLYIEMHPYSELEEELTADEAKELEYMTQKVDLVAFEEKLQHRPIFTKELLGKFARLVRNEAGASDIVKASDVNGKEWVAFLPLPKEDWQSKELHMEYQNYCQLAPDHHPAVPSSTQEVLQDMNDEGLEDENEHIPLPVSMTTGGDKARLENARKVRQGGPKAREYFFDLLTQLRTLWGGSTSAAHLRAQFSKAATDSVQIKKIVCFGFGGIRYDFDRRQADLRVWSPLQHMAALTIATTLNKEYRKQNAATPPVKLILQDPEYTENDRIFWRRAGYPHMEFVRDPLGFLAVDEHTLVIGPHLPHCVPLVQICADIVEGGPAGFIVDKMNLDTNKRMWCTRDRASPKVARLLTREYVKTDFDHHVLERELWEKALDGGSYWLWAMDCFLKPKSKPNPVLVNGRSGPSQQRGANMYAALEACEDGR